MKKKPPVITVPPDTDIPTCINRYGRALHVEQLSTLMSVDEASIYRMVNSEPPRIPFYRIGTLIRFDPKITAQWLRERMV